MRIVAVVAVLLSLSLHGCGDKDKEKAKKLAGLCVEAGKQLADDSGKTDNDTFMLTLKNALTACSGGCDGKDDASCKELDGHLGKICGVKAGMCDSLCASAKSPSLKKYSCAHGTKK